MEPMLFDENGFVRKNRRVFLVGTNYMPSKSFHRMWEDWLRTERKMGKTLMEMNFDPNEVKILRLKR